MSKKKYQSVLISSYAWRLRNGVVLVTYVCFQAIAGVTQATFKKRKGDEVCASILNYRYVGRQVTSAITPSTHQHINAHETKRKTLVSPPSDMPTMIRSLMSRWNKSLGSLVTPVYTERMHSSIWYHLLESLYNLASLSCLYSMCQCKTPGPKSNTNRLMLPKEYPIVRENEKGFKLQRVHYLLGTQSSPTVVSEVVILACLLVNDSHPKRAVGRLKWCSLWTLYPQWE